MPRRETPQLYVPLVQLATELGVRISLSYHPVHREVLMTSPKRRTGGAIRFRGLATEGVIPVVTMLGINTLSEENWERLHAVASRLSAGGWAIYSDPDASGA